MPRFLVTVQRTTIETTEVPITASSEEEAYDLATSSVEKQPERNRDWELIETEIEAIDVSEDEGWG